MLNKNQFWKDATDIVVPLVGRHNWVVWATLTTV